MPKTSGVAREIQQGKPFRSRAQEATVSLLRTASVVNRVVSRSIEASGLSFAQYNALRIVRGAGAGGIPTLDVRQRMIEEGTTITRILDKLEEAELITRERAEPDRRQVMCFVSPKGRRLLDTLDPIVDSADEAAVSALGARQLDTLIELLDAIRRSNAHRGAPRTMVRA
jgi:DNA-binding MarR family transcriptional regulator